MQSGRVLEFQIIFLSIVSRCAVWGGGSGAPLNVEDYERQLRFLEALQPPLAEWLSALNTGRTRDEILVRFCGAHLWRQMVEIVDELRGWATNSLAEARYIRDGRWLAERSIAIHIANALIAYNNKFRPNTYLWADLDHLEVIFSALHANYNSALRLVSKQIVKNITHLDYFLSNALSAITALPYRIEISEARIGIRVVALSSCMQKVVCSFEECARKNATRTDSQQLLQSGRHGGGKQESDKPEGDSSEGGRNEGGERESKKSVARKVMSAFGKLRIRRRRTHKESPQTRETTASIAGQSGIPTRGSTMGISRPSAYCEGPSSSSAFGAIPKVPQQKPRRSTVKKSMSFDSNLRPITEFVPFKSAVPCRPALNYANQVHLLWKAIGTVERWASICQKTSIFKKKKSKYEDFENSLRNFLIKKGGKVEFPPLPLTMSLDFSDELIEELEDLLRHTQYLQRAQSAKVVDYRGKVERAFYANCLLRAWHFVRTAHIQIRKNPLRLLCQSQLPRQLWLLDAAVEAKMARLECKIRAIEDVWLFACDHSPVMVQVLARIERMALRVHFLADGRGALFLHKDTPLLRDRPLTLPDL